MSPTSYQLLHPAMYFFLSELLSDLEPVLKLPLPANSSTGNLNGTAKIGLHPDKPKSFQFYLKMKSTIRATSKAAPNNEHPIPVRSLMQKFVARLKCEALEESLFTMRI